jgi:hypothetical protein
MSVEKLNRITGRLVLLLSLLALATVLLGFTEPRRTFQADEGTLAHIFQLSIAAVVPAILVFLFTANSKQPGPSARLLVFSVSALLLAFSALYCLEHFWLQSR